jgi:Domain of unknown function (DUF5601)
VKLRDDRAAPIALELQRFVHKHLSKLKHSRNTSSAQSSAPSPLSASSPSESTTVSVSQSTVPPLAPLSSSSSSSSSSPPPHAFSSSLPLSFASSSKHSQPSHLAREVHQFVMKLYGTICRHHVWEDASDDELDNVLENLEKFVLTKLYSVMFTGTKGEVKKNAQLDRKIRLLDCFIQPRHLDIPEMWFLRGDEFIHSAAFELGKIAVYKAPRDKIICLLNCCKIVMGTFSASASAVPITFIYCIFYFIFICLLRCFNFHIAIPSYHGACLACLIAFSSIQITSSHFNDQHKHHRQMLWWTGMIIPKSHNVATSIDHQAWMTFSPF